MKKQVKILYLGWLGQGNVGDDILFDIFKAYLLKYFESQQPFINCQIDSFLPIDNYKINLNKYDLIVLGGGSLFLPYWLSI